MQRLNVNYINITNLSDHKFTKSKRSKLKSRCSQMFKWIHYVKNCPYSELFWSVFFRIRTEYGYSVSLCVQSGCEKIRARIISNTDTFYALITFVIFPKNFVRWCPLQMLPWKFLDIFKIIIYLMMNSVTRSLNIVTILTKTKIKKQIFVNKNYIFDLHMQEAIFRVFFHV